MNDLSNEERETTFSMTGDDHEIFLVFSDDPYWIRRLDKLAEYVRDVGVGKEYKLRAEQILVRKGKPNRPMSNERRAQLAESMRKMTAVRMGTVNGDRERVTE